MTAAETPATSPGAPAALRLVRHRLPDRIFHWLNAAVVLTLLGTSFLAIAGFKFPWVTAHWIAGVLLSALILCHAIRALFWQDPRAMWIGRRDLRRATQMLRWNLRLTAEPPIRPGKYLTLQKLFHHGLAVIILATIVTGLLMLAKIDTPFWQRNPYFLESGTWGVVYVVHGLAAMAVLAMLIIHVYFALRPEKLWITRSMIAGWITHNEYRDHHDPDAWRPESGAGP